MPSRLLKTLLLKTLLLGLLAVGSCQAALARHPDPETWPRTANPDKTVHFVSTDNSFKPLSAKWLPNLKILTGGDQPTEPVTIGGHPAVKVAGFKFNTADDQYPVWAEQHTIDILIEFYGDGAFLNPDGTPRYCNFLTGTLPEPIAVDGGSIPPRARNGRWNWVLFRIPNGLRHMDGGRLVGTIHPRARVDPLIAEVSKLSGQNGGTIRLDGLPGLIVRVVAFGEQGAFGERDQVNQFKR